VIGGAPAEVVDGGGFNHRHLGGAAPSGCVRDKPSEKSKKPSTNVVVAPVRPAVSRAETRRTGKCVSVQKRIWVLVWFGLLFYRPSSVSPPNPLAASLYTTTLCWFFQWPSKRCRLPLC